MDPLMMYGGYGMNPYMMNNDLMMAPFLNSYQNQVFLMDNYSSLNADMMSMNGSIFPNFTGTFDYDQYYKNMQKSQDYMFDNQLRQTQRWRSNELEINSPMEEIHEKVELLHGKIIENEQEQILDAFEDLKESVRHAYAAAGSEPTEEQVTTRAMSLYKSNNGGKGLLEDIREHANGSFKQGFLQAITAGFIVDGITAEENISAITGQPVGRKENNLKKTGNMLGGATLGAVGLALLSKIKWIAPLFKSRPLWAAIAGGIGGAIAAPALGAKQS